MHDEEVLDEIKTVIDSLMDEEITLKKISDRICYSGEYTSRFFKRMTGEKLFDYIRGKRLLRAAEIIRSEGGKIIDVALDNGFNSHEGFTRAFSSYFGISPLKFRQIRPEIKHFMPVGLKALPLVYKENDMENFMIFTQVISKPERRLLFLRGKKAMHYFEYCEEVGCDIWGRLLEVKDALYEPVGLWLPEIYRTAGTSEYVQGVEVAVDYDGDIPTGLESITLPPFDFMLFQSEPYEESDEKMIEVITSVQKAVKLYNPGLYGFEWAEDSAPRFQPAPLGERGYMEAVPVRRLK